MVNPLRGTTLSGVAEFVQIVLESCNFALKNSVYRYKLHKESTLLINGYFLVNVAVTRLPDWLFGVATSI
jgi:hypothetical protein